MTARLALVLLAFGTIAAGVAGFVGFLGPGALTEGLQLAAVAGLAASAAHFAIGLPGRPMLALSLPILAGWSVALALPAASPSLTLLLAAFAGSVVGAALGPSAALRPMVCAASTLFLAVLVEVSAAGHAGSRLVAGDALAGAWQAAVALAAVALAVAWWSEASLGAALLRAARQPRLAANLGLPPLRLLVTSAAFGGAAAGVAGVVLAGAGSSAPSPVLGLVLAVAVLIGGAGSISGTLAAVAGLWLLPELALRALPSALGGDPLLAVVGTVALAMFLLMRSGRRWWRSVDG
ncbi:MAG: hypothetical protein AAFX81_11635 [Pseudomonadota bacterium]